MIHNSIVKRWARKARLAEAPAEDCAETGTCLRPVRLRPSRSPANLGSRHKEVKNDPSMGLVHLCPSLWKMAGICRVLASTRDPVTALLTAGRQRGSHILGN